jgi:hypothetical protein
MNGAEVVIADAHNRIVTSGTVTRYAVSCPLITGYTSKEGFPPETDPVEGYFVIDTESGTSILGMTETEWSRKLGVTGWQHPSMHDIHSTRLPAKADRQN